MYFKFKCKHCGNDLKVAEEKAGMKARCPHCDETLVVPPPPWVEGEPVGEEEGSPEPRAQTGKGRRASRGRSRGKSERSADRERPSHRGRSQKAALTSGTDVPALRSLLVGAGLAVLFYVVILPLSGTYFGALFFRRGWVPYVEVVLMGWAVAILVLKWRAFRHQRAAMLLDALPTSLGEDISEENVDRFLDHIKRVRSNLRDSIMVNRIRKALEHFRVRRSNPEVASMLSAQSDIDANSLYSSYTMVRVLIWAIPILGFIGTVLGISDAVSGFSESLDQAQEIETLKASLDTVTSGLALAFDTTLVALCMSVIISFPAHSLQKSEEDLLTWVDEYCGENLLKRLNDAGGVSDVASHTETLAQSLGAAVADEQREIVRELRDAAQGMSRVQGEQAKQFNALAKSIDGQSKAIEQRAIDHQAKVEEGLTRMTEEVEKAVSRLADRLSETADGRADQIEEDARAHRAAIEEALRETFAPVRQAMDELLERGGAAQKEGLETINAHVAALGEGIQSLNDVLGKLDGKQVVIHRGPPWWWPFGRKRHEQPQEATQEQTEEHEEAADGPAQTP